MGSFVIIVIIGLSALIMARKCGEDVFDTLPFTAACSILYLYLMAFFHALPVAGWILAAGGIAAAVAGAVLSRKICQPPVLRFAGRSAEPPDPMTLLAFALIAAAGILASSRVVTWWDDMNFWANDAKYFWHMGGLAGKYGNVSPEFGDYPPGTGLWKYLFLALSPQVYREGLQYTAYHVMNMIFLLPLCKAARGFRSLPARLAAVPAVFLLPGAVSGLQFDGAAADIPMGCTFGALLLVLMEETPGEKWFRNARIAVYGGVLVLMKFTGILWLLAALAFYVFVLRPLRKQERILLPAVFSITVWLSWIAYCLITRRVAGLTGEAIRVVRGRTQLPQEAGDYLAAYVKAFFFRPLHIDRNLTLDLSAAGMLAIILISTVILYLRKKDILFLRLLAYEAVLGALVYGALLACHVTIFRTETQYLDDYGMSLSISRYGAPFLLGLLMVLLVRIAKIGRVQHPSYLLFLLLPILTADYAGEVRAFLTYRAEREQALAVREETIDPVGREFLAYLAEHPELRGRRVLFLRDPAVNHMVKNAFIAYEACPVSVVFANIPEDPAEIPTLADTLHAVFVYPGMKSD